MVAALKMDTAFVSSSLVSFSAPRDGLKKFLRRLASVADRRSSLPVLGMILIRVDGTGTTFMATDLNVSLTMRAGAWIGDRGGMCIPAKTLSDLVAKLPDGDVRIAAVSNTETEISCGPVTMRIESTPDRDFPKIARVDESSWSTVGAGAFSEMFEKALPFVCEDQTRFHLNGILFESDGTTVRTVSTDGHRLTKCQRSLYGAAAIPNGVIVPSKGCAQIIKMLGKARGDCQFAVSRHNMFVRYEGDTLAIKLIDSQFPAYDQVIPTTNEGIFSVDRKLLIAGLERAALGTDEQHGVKFTIGRGTLTLTSKFSETMKAVGIGTETEIGTRAIGFNARYLIEVLESIDDSDVTFAIGGELDPAVIRGCEHACSYSVQQSPQLSVLMPMRL